MGKQQLYTVVPWDKMLWMPPDRLCPLRPSNQQPSAVISLFAFQLLYCQQRKLQSPSRQGRASLWPELRSHCRHKWLETDFSSIDDTCLGLNRANLTFSNHNLTTFIYVVLFLINNGCFALTSVRMTNNFDNKTKNELNMSGLQLLYSCCLSIETISVIIKYRP